MSKSSVKPKAAAIWGKQTEKLRQRLSSITDLTLYFEKEKLAEMLQRIQNNVGNHELEIITRR